MIWERLLLTLKLPSLFASWRFWTFHIKSHNMKALVILSHSWSPFIPLTCLYGKKWTFVGICTAFWVISLRKNSLQITHTNHMTMTTRRQIWSWPINRNISHCMKLFSEWDFFLIRIVYPYIWLLHVHYIIKGPLSLMNMLVSPQCFVLNLKRKP